MTTTRGQRASDSLISSATAPTGSPSIYFCTVFIFRKSTAKIAIFASPVKKIGCRQCCSVRQPTVRYSIVISEDKPALVSFMFLFSTLHLVEELGLGRSHLVKIAVPGRFLFWEFGISIYPDSIADAKIHLVRRYRLPMLIPFNISLDELSFLLSISNNLTVSEVCAMQHGVILVLIAHYTAI